MFRYILNRFVSVVLTLWVIATITFILMHAVPGGPFSTEKNVPQAVLNNLNAKYHLNWPIHKQYVHYLKGILSWDFGPSFRYRDRTVNDIIRDGFPVSAILGGVSLTISILVGVSAGVISALRKNKWPDYLAMFLAVVGYSVPNFIMATLLIFFFSYKLHWFPSSLWGRWDQVILPAISLAGLPTAFIARMVRTTMLEALAQDYVQVAWAKGMNARVVVLRHALRNALLPVITYLGPLTAAILTGSFVIETIFAIPGIGRDFVQSIGNRDYTMIMGLTVFYSILLVSANFIVDVLYSIVDPRIKVVGGGRLNMSVSTSELFRPAGKTDVAQDRFVRPPTTYWKDAWFRLKKNRLALTGLIIIAIVILIAIFGPIFSPYSYDAQKLVENNQPPSAKHPFGTDNLGRDLMTRTFYGARISLSVGFLASLIALGIGVPYGAVSGYFGGYVDNIMMRIVEVLYGLPFQLYVILLTVVLGTGLQNVFIAIGLVYWLDMARIVRAEVLSLKEREFVLAARTMGVSPWRIVFRHLVPNAIGPIIVTITLMIPQAIFTEAFLSFIGLGVNAPMASWGALASDGYPAIRVAPWQLLFPAGAISITMLAFNFLGDGLRDALDPWMRR